MSLHLHAGSVFGLVDSVDEKGEWPNNVEDLHIPSFDTGVFISELANLEKLPQKLQNITDEDRLNAQKNPESALIAAQAQQLAPLEEGTWRGTQLALTKIYDLIERKYSSFMDVVNFEPTVPSPLTLEQKRQIFQFSDPNEDRFPPHLNLGGSTAQLAKGLDKDIPKGTVQRPDLGPGDIFNKLRLAQLTTLVPTVVPNTFIGRTEAKLGQFVAWLNFGSMGTPDQGDKIADVEEYNSRMRHRWSHQKDIFDLPNIGDLSDWYTDERFAQQAFTGTNPVTIELASDFWIRHFIDSATNPEDQVMKEKITRIATQDKTSLYVQDCSYFRKAAGVPESDVITCLAKDDVREGEKVSTREMRRYTVAAVCLYYLDENGKLSPLAIVIDWRGSSKNSVTVYNRERSRSDQAHDWVWRYAKTCMQTSDWMRHEVTVHLTDTHFIEEATIVAAQRSFENDHPVFRLLYPHWQKTLSLNAAGRDTLIPHVIAPLNGFAENQVYEFIRSEYSNFDFEGSYVPNDLRRRGFPPENLGHRKYHNYAYARCIYSMWFKIRSFVTDMLSIHYHGKDADQQVADDQYIRSWYEILQAPAGGLSLGGGMPTFPTIKTFEGLVDAVTMCIHIASPQHTAVNYLQNYYQSFVINRPPCLYAEPPRTRAELEAYKEKDLVSALPMNHPHDWLLASHIPYLLSFKPGDKESLIIYAASKYNVYKKKREPEEKAIADAAAKFYTALAKSELEFRRYGKDTDDSDTITYEVLSPSWNAVSILI